MKTEKQQKQQDTEAVVISLGRTPQRLEEFSANNGSIIKFNVFQAIDGLQLESAGFDAEPYFHNLKRFAAGPIGNALSHFRLWERAVASNQCLTIFEDDAQLHRRFQPMSDDIIASLPRDWDFISWGWNFDSVLVADLIPGLSRGIARFDQLTMRKMAREYLGSDTEPRALRLYNMFGIFCYTVSPSGAKNLLKALKPLKADGVFIPGLNRALTSVAIDIGMNKYYSLLNCFVAFPPLAVTNNDKQVSTVSALR